jgi:hypothetical protein
VITGKNIPVICGYFSSSAERLLSIPEGFSSVRSNFKEQALFEKQVVLQVVKKFPTFYGM